MKLESKLPAPEKQTSRNVAVAKKLGDVVQTLDIHAPVQLSAEELAQLEALRNMPDSAIDYSDIPKHTGDFLAPHLRVNPPYHPRKGSAE